MKSRVKEKYDRDTAKKVEKWLTEFKTFNRVKDDIARQMVAAMLYAYHLKGYREKRINDMFEEFVRINDMPEVLGQSIEAVDIMDFLSKKYGVDFNRIQLRTETETEYIQRMLK